MLPFSWYGYRIGWCVRVIFGNTKASIGWTLPAWFVSVICTLTSPLDRICHIDPPIQLMVGPWWWSDSHSCCANRSVINEAFHPESSDAFTWTVAPLGARMMTWQVISSMLPCPSFMWRLVTIFFSLASGVSGDDLISTLLESWCNKVWCLPWHSSNLRVDLYWLQ